MVVPQRFGLADRMPDQAEQDLRPEPVQYPYQQGQYGKCRQQRESACSGRAQPGFLQIAFERLQQEEFLGRILCEYFHVVVFGEACEELFR